LIFVPYFLFSKWSEAKVKKRGEAYNAIKNKLGKKAAEQIVKLYPNLKVKIIN
jgi:all-trans-retinol 13,14-reductase